MKCFPTISLVIALLSSASCSEIFSADAALPHSDEYFLSDLLEASEWIIRYGNKIYNEIGLDEFREKILNDWIVQLNASPLIDSNTYISQFNLRVDRYNNQIINLHQETIENSIYEYWIVNTTTVKERTEKFRTKFFVTRTTDRVGERVILTDSEQFIDSHIINASKKFKLPVKNLKILYQMKAWAFPLSHINSGLDKIKVNVRKLENDRLNYYIEN